MMKDCQTKYRIMETAIELIWQSSYDGVGVSDICKKAKVNKGSFYHFFPSKEVLAIEAMEEHWKCVQPMLDQVFSPQKDPVERLMDYCDHSLQKQIEKKEELGYVCGCPFTTVGMEKCGQSEAIRQTVEKLFGQMKKYFASAIKDAADEGMISVKSVPKKTNELYTFYLGALTQARITNDLQIVSNLKQEFKDLLGITKETAKA